MVIQPVATISMEDILRIIARDFGAFDRQDILAILKKYREEDGVGERRVWASVLRLSAGDPERLRHLVALALNDYRDILAAGEYPSFCEKIGFNTEVDSKHELEAAWQADWESYRRWLQNPGQEKVADQSPPLQELGERSCKEILDMARIRQRNGLFAEAADGYEKVLQHWAAAGRDPDIQMHRTCLRLALAYRAMDLPAKALSSCQIVKIDPDAHGPLYSNLLFYRGCFLFALGRIEEGKSAHGHLLTLLNLPESAKDFSPEYVHDRDLELAIQDCGQADALWSQSLARRSRKDWQGACTNLQTAISKEPGDNSLQTWLVATALFMSGLPDKEPTTLPEGIEYLRVQYDCDTPETVYIGRFTPIDGWTRTPYGQVEGRRIHEQVRKDPAFILLSNRCNKEGSVHCYWREATVDHRTP